MITFSCEFCARKYRVDDGLAGRKVKCKECGTELSIPSPGKVAASTASAPKVDLYGLDDQDEAPLPPPRRPGMPSEASPSRGGSRTRSSSADESPLKRLGFTLMIGGVLAFVLPMVGLQIKGLHMMSPQAQMTGGVLLLAVGGFCLLLGKFGVLKGLGVTIGGAVGLIVLILVAASFRGPRAPRIPAPNFGPNRRPADAAGGGLFQQFAEKNHPGAAENSKRVTITGGRARQARGPGGFGAMGGVTIEIDYRLDPVHAGLYDLFLKSARGEVTQIVPPVHLMPSGSVSMTVPQARQEEGPFEAYFEGQSFGPDGITRGRASGSVTLTWSESPPEENPFQPPPGSNARNIPRPPGFRPPGMPPIPMGPRFGPQGPR